MQFVKPNVLHRPGPAVSQDHGFADKLGLGFFESAEDRGRTDLRPKGSKSSGGSKGASI
jgi:hypothetical protein